MRSGFGCCGLKVHSVAVAVELLIGVLGHGQDLERRTVSSGARSQSSLLCLQS